MLRKPFPALLSVSKSSFLFLIFFQKVPKPFGNKTSEDTKLRFFVGFLFLSCSLLIGAAHVLYYQHLGEVSLKINLYFKMYLISRGQIVTDVVLVILIFIFGFVWNDKVELFSCRINWQIELV